MLNYAEWMFYAHGREKGFRTTRIEAWSKIKKQTGKSAGEDRPDFPKAGYLWNIYGDIREGVDVVDYHAIDVYCRLKEDKLTVWEIDQIIKVEHLRIKHAN